MILADKIMKLRKQLGWSQEELAEKLNVSRQSVSKWESTTSIPDLKKIIKLADIFGVSTDYLLKDEIEEIETTGVDKETGFIKVSLEEALQYVEDKIRASKITAIGVFIVIGSIIPMMLLFALSEREGSFVTSNIAAGIGILAILVLISVAISFFLRSSQLGQEFSYIEEGDFELEYGVYSIFKEKVKQYTPIYIMRTTISVAMFIISPVPLILAAFFGGSGSFILLMVTVLLTMIGFGVFIIIPVSAKQNAYNCVIQEGEFAQSKRSENKRIEKLGAFYFPLITAIYIGWSLWTMDWGTTWIIWPIAAIVFAALVGLMGLFDLRE